ncbi:MAG: two-component regulator propeller domain-containing protein [Bacteroidota bacterium]
MNDPENPNSLNGDRVFGVVVDEQGYVWAKTKDYLNKLDTATGKITYYEHYFDPFNEPEQTYPFPIFLDSQNNLWFGTQDGLFLFDRDYEQFMRFNTKNSDISDNQVNAIAEDSDGNLWIGTKNGLNRFNFKKKEFVNYYHDESNPKSLSNNFVRAIYQDHMGNIWVGTFGGGLNRLDPETGDISIFEPNIDDPAAISHTLILSIFEDRSNNLWVGTYGGGLNKVDLKARKLRLYTQHNSGFNFNDMAALYEDEDGVIWIGSFGDGLNTYNRKTGEVEYLSETTPGKKKLLNNFVHVIFKDSRGLLWLGTRKGVNIYLKETDEIITLDDYLGISTFSTRVNSIIEDKYNNIWIGTDRGLYHVDIEDREITCHMKNSQDPESISDNHVYSVVEDHEGFIWVGTINGLNMFNPVTGVFKQFKSDIKNRNTISNNRVFYVMEDSENYIWITTGSGLNRFNKKDTTFTIYTKNEGLPNDLIYNMLEDRNGDLWLSTGYGLAKLNPHTKEIRAYDKADGLGSLEHNLGSFFLSKSGEVFFGGNNGFNSFFPDSMFENPFKPKTVLLRYKKTNAQGTFTNSLEDVQEIVLKYSDHTITIYFAALEFTYPKKNKFKYRMIGMSDEWVDNGTQNFRTFSNIPPGEYEFQVMGSNNDLVWDTTGAKLKILVKDPWWQTIWAYLSYIAVVVLTIYYIFKLRTKKLRDANQALRIKQMAALEIAKQKEELSIKNKSITDSINYAKRIQEAMMPSEFLFKKLLPQSFILYKPKDLVSGDFYWIAEKANKIFIAAVDCTGHGVPGAFMSIIGFDLLRNIIKEQGIENPAQILNQLNSGVSETFSKNIDDQEVKDGMDVSLCVIDQNQKHIEYAGAMNPLYIIRENKIIEVKGNRFSVGTSGFSMEDQRFENHIVPYKTNDMVYIFSDGYADQFGGPLGKKFKFRRFRHLLLTIHNLPVHKQKSFLDENVENWRGELEQVDDLLVIGMKL